MYSITIHYNYYFSLVLKLHWIKKIHDRNRGQLAPVHTYGMTLYAQYMTASTLTGDVEPDGVELLPRCVGHSAFVLPFIIPGSVLNLQGPTLQFHNSPTLHLPHQGSLLRPCNVRERPTTCSAGQLHSVKFRHSYNGGEVCNSEGRRCCGSSSTIGVTR